MAKARDTAFFCKECGYESAKWFGQCPACREWNTASEEPVAKTKTAKGKGAPVHIVSDGKNEPSKLADINTKETDRMSTGIKELDRVLGGGIVAGSLVLVGGDPGIGKSTLLLQMCKNLSHMDKNVLYISGEESLKQIKMRAERIGTFTDKLLLLCETNLDIIEETMKKTMPDVVIIDSIQTMYREDVGSAPGSVSQVRESTAVLMQLAKGLGISIFIVGHVTKEGVVAGPRMLEHMVDTVLYFEGDKNAPYRLLRGVKNRFGSTNEIGVFEMQEQGLVEVENPSEYIQRVLCTQGILYTIGVSLVQRMPFPRFREECDREGDKENGDEGKRDFRRRRQARFGETNEPHGRRHHAKHPGYGEAHFDRGGSVPIHDRSHRKAGGRHERYAPLPFPRQGPTPRASPGRVRGSSRGKAR